MKPWLQLHCVFQVVVNEMQHSKARLVKGVLRGDSYSYSYSSPVVKRNTENTNRKLSCSIAFPMKH